MKTTKTITREMVDINREEVLNLMHIFIKRNEMTKELEKLFMNAILNDNSNSTLEQRYNGYIKVIDYVWSFE